MNFANLAGFQAIEFVDQPVLETLNIFVLCLLDERIQSFLNKMQYSLTVIHRMSTDESTCRNSHPQFSHFLLGMPSDEHLSLENSCGN